jgi:hypothetical protein
MRTRTKQLIFPTEEKRISKSELETIGRALRANVKAAKNIIAALGPKLKAEFEAELLIVYPASGDPVWNEALSALYAEYEKQKVRVEARCKELGIPERFWPRLEPPGWVSGWQEGAGPDYKELRAEMRRLAHLQIDDMLKSRVAKLELDAANIQFEIASHGCVTDAAKDFLARLPKAEEMVKPVKVSDVEAMLEGKVPRLTAKVDGKLQLLSGSEAKGAQ